MTSSEGLVEVYRSSNHTEAHLLKAFLDQQGIRAEVFDELSGLLGEADPRVRLMVPSADSRQAQKAIEAYFKSAGG